MANFLQKFYAVAPLRCPPNLQKNDINLAVITYNKRIMRSSRKVYKERKSFGQNLSCFHFSFDYQKYSKISEFDHRKFSI